MNDALCILFLKNVCKDEIQNISIQTVFYSSLTYFSVIIILVEKINSKINMKSSRC